MSGKIRWMDPRFPDNGTAHPHTGQCPFHPLCRRRDAWATHRQILNCRRPHSASHRLASPSTLFSRFRPRPGPVLPTLPVSLRLPPPLPAYRLPQPQRPAARNGRRTISRCLARGSRADDAPAARRGRVFVSRCGAHPLLWLPPYLAPYHHRYWLAPRRRGAGLTPAVQLPPKPAHHLTPGRFVVAGSRCCSQTSAGTRCRSRP